MILHSESCGAGPPVVLLHGFTTHGGAWADVRARLQSRFRVISIDLPGHGRSPAPSGDYDFSACVDDVVTTVRSNSIDTPEPAALIGYSMGGRIALAVALRAPAVIGRLVLESTSPGIADAAERAERRAADAALAESIESEAWDRFVDRWLAQPLFRTLQSLEPAVAQRSRAVRLDNRGATIAAALRCLGTGSQPSYWEQLSSVRQPVLLISGELDEKFTSIAARMHQRLPRRPDNRLCVVPGVGHTTHLENPATFTGVVQDFLAASLPVDATIAAP